MGTQSIGRRPGFWARAFSLALLALAGLAFAGLANAQSAAQRAVDAAKKICAGKTITIVWEAGLQSLDPKNFSVVIAGDLAGAAKSGAAEK